MAGAMRRLLVCALAVAGLGWAPAAHAAGARGLVVIPHPASSNGLSYFKLTAPPGTAARAGTIELRNSSSSALRVALAPVNGLTLDTLGSTYATAGSRTQGSTRWLRVGARRVTLPAGRGAVIPVSVAVPATAGPGDYLAGISIEALGQRQGTARHGVSIASVDRYAIGVETTLPGPRHPALRFTGAALEREPAGLAFLLDARNAGNVILQGVHGAVRVTRGGHTVLSRPIEPGTFVTDTKIAYPVPAFGEHPPEGTRYGVSAWLRYAGGVARLNATLTFGHRQAIAQQRYSGTPAAGGGTGTAWWKIALLAGAILYGLMTTVLLLRRRARETSGEQAP
jgi:hypothetical protein